jgi:hypothetical protein
MILPTKHIKLSNTLLMLGAVLLKKINNGQTVTLLWEKTKGTSEIKSFERFVLGLDLLCMLNLIEFKDGLIVRTKK